MKEIGELVELVAPYWYLYLLVLGGAHPVPSS
jgi:hypothetical protein